MYHYAFVVVLLFVCYPMHVVPQPSCEELECSVWTLPSCTDDAGCIEAARGRFCYQPDKFECVRGKCGLWCGGSYQCTCFEWLDRIDGWPAEDTEDTEDTNPPPVVARVPKSCQRAQG